METKVISANQERVVIEVDRFEITFAVIGGKVRKIGVIEKERTRSDGYIPSIYFKPAVKRAIAIFHSRNRI